MTRGSNDLLNTAYRNLDRDNRKELIFTAVAVVLIVIVWSLP